MDAPDSIHSENEDRCRLDFRVMNKSSAEYKTLFDLLGRTNDMTRPQLSDWNDQRFILLNADIVQCFNQILENTFEGKESEYASHFMFGWFPDFCLLTIKIYYQGIKMLPQDGFFELKGNLENHFKAVWKMKSMILPNGGHRFYFSKRFRSAFETLVKALDPFELIPLEEIDLLPCDYANGNCKESIFPSYDERCKDWVCEDKKGSPTENAVQHILLNIMKLASLEDITIPLNFNAACCIPCKVRDNWVNHWLDNKHDKLSDLGWGCYDFFLYLPKNYQVPRNPLTMALGLKNILDKPNRKNLLVAIAVKTGDTKLTPLQQATLEDFQTKQSQNFECHYFVLKVDLRKKRKERSTMIVTKHASAFKFQENWEWREFMFSPQHEEPSRKQVQVPSIKEQENQRIEKEKLEEGNRFEEYSYLADSYLGDSYLAELIEEEYWGGAIGRAKEDEELEEELVKEILRRSQEDDDLEEVFVNETLRISDKYIKMVEKDELHEAARLSAVDAYYLAREQARIEKLDEEELVTIQLQQENESQILSLEELSLD